MGSTGATAASFAFTTLMTATASPQSIEEALELEQLDLDIFRSVRLWKPLTGRGAFGGQIIAQSTRASGATVDPELHLHSLHSYFLSFGDVDLPVLYCIERLRDGKSYATRTVRAIQRGKPIFILSASYQRPEPQQPTFQVSMNALTSAGDIFANIPQPEECLPVEEGVQNLLKENPNMSERLRKYFLNTAEERRLSSIEIRSAYPADSMPFDSPSERDTSQQAIWFKARAPLPEDPAFQKCVIAYASDFAFIGTAAKALRLKTTREPKLGMMASLDHSMHFYSSVDPSQWLLFIMEATAAGHGRGLVKGRIYTQEGKLAVVVQQEGVVRQAIKSRL